MKYEQFIQGILETRGRKILKEDKGYTEEHHIVPRCLGGADTKTNLIELYAREHFIAHKLLAEENPTNLKLQFAFGAMSQDNRGKRQDITPEQYEEAREVMSKAMSIKNAGTGNPMYGVHRYGKDNPNYGKKHPGMGAGAKNSQYGKHYTLSYEEKLARSKRVKATWDSYTQEEREQRGSLVQGERNGMYGRYGYTKRCVKVKCIETGEIFVSISDAERKFGKGGLKAALRLKKNFWQGFHWERLD